MIEYRLYVPDILDQEDWRDLQSIQRSAYTTTINRSQADIDALVDWDDPERYYQSHIDPNSEVGKRFNANQEYTNPKVAVAIDEVKDETVGFAYSAYNVSADSALKRRIKKGIVSKNYLWFRELAVKPDYQRREISKHMARVLLTPVNPESPVTAYAWVDEIDFSADTLNLFHLFPTGETLVKPFGQSGEPVRQVRFQGRAGDIKSALSMNLS